MVVGGEGWFFVVKGGFLRFVVVAVVFGGGEGMVLAFVRWGFGGMMVRRKAHQGGREERGKYTHRHRHHSRRRLT